MKKLLLTLLFSSLCFTSASMALEKHNAKITFQVIKQQYQINRKQILSAKIVKSTTMANRYNIDIKLSKQASKQLNNLTAKNIAKWMNIVWQKKILASAVIQSPLVGSFEISGLSKQQAQSLVLALKKN